MKLSRRPKPGDRIKIYQRPLTFEKFEGVAEVVTVQENPQDPNSIYADVIFEGDACTVRRFIQQPYDIVTAGT